MDDYKDIIKIKKHEPSYKHPRMSIESRSGIFAPFSSLSGYKEEIDETSRTTDNKIELDEDSKEKINNILINLNKNQEVMIEYFIKDNKKTGGKYIKVSGIIKKIDYINKEIIMIDKTKISINNIINIK